MATKSARSTKSSTLEKRPGDGLAVRQVNMGTNSARSTKSSTLENRPGIIRQSSFDTREMMITRKIQPTKPKALKPVIKSANIPKLSQAKENKTESTDKKTSEQEYKDAAAKFNKLLGGCLEDLPSLPRSTVRIFISSTFSDMRAERNAIVKDVIPLLKEHCAQYDLDFQLVDMRWGVTEDSQNDHSVERICLLEVENCQKISLGPNFILISGDRYGFRPIPTEIALEEFDIIKKFAIEESVPDAKLLDIWYLLDENASPQQYVLQPIRSQFTFYGDYSPGCDEPRAKDHLAWEQTFSSLQQVLRQSATLAFKAKKLTEKQLHDYFQSVTEIEVEKGILTATEPEIHTCVYQRRLRGLDGDNIRDNIAKRYFDTTTKNGKIILDEEAKSLREKVVMEKVPSAMNKSERVHVYQPQWYDGEIDPDKHSDHKNYVTKLCSDLIQDITDLIDKARKDQKNLVKILEYYTDYQEVLHHLHFCNLKCETFCGREDVLLKAKEYILNDKSRKPLILHAPSGAGKTSIMAKIMETLPEWFDKQSYVGVVKFLGTSPLSINIYDVLYGLCGHLADSAQILMEPVGYKTMKNILEYMPRFLRRVSSKLKKPIVILLDSLDQLSPNSDAHLCNWLPTVLPANVRLIVSTLPEEHEILETLKKIFPETSFVEVPALSDEAGFEMIDKYLAKKKRAVTQFQTKQIINAFRKCRGALYLKLVLDEAVAWCSYTPEHKVVLQYTVQGAINQLFDNMEKKFGKVLISHALGYITVAFNGISDIEWEDVLSCDDEVLDDIYRYHNPPVPGIVRMPPVLVARIRYDLREYIVERRSFGKTTLNWYHRQFIETAHSRYAVGDGGKKLHKVLAEYFMANDGIQRDITLHRRKLTVEKADRQVTKQPLTVKNKRKLTAGPYHITHAGDQIDSSKAKTDCFCNLDFLKVRIASLPLSSLVEDMTQYLEKTEDEEVAYLRNYFMVTKTDSGGINLAISFLSSLLVDDDQKYLNQLVEQAKDLVYSSSLPLLVPVFPCLAPRKDASSALLQNYNGIDGIIAEGHEAVLMTNLKEDETDVVQYSVYDCVNAEIYSLVQNKDVKPILSPLLDCSEKRVIQIAKDRLLTTHFHSQTVNEKKFTDICNEIEVQKSYPVRSALSTESMHITILFSNGEVLTFDTNSLKKVDIFTLREEPSDVVNIITTGVDNLRVILTIDCDVTQKDSQTGGCVRFHVVGDLENGKMLKTPCCFNKDLVAIGYNETLLVGCSNNQEKGSITVIDVDGIKILNTKDCFKVMQLSVSHSDKRAAIWLEEGSIAIYKLKKGEIVKELHINNTITSFGVSWIHDLVLIGDNQGQITMYKVETGKHLGDFKANKNEIVKIAVLEDEIVSLSKANAVKVWQISSLLDAECVTSNMEIQSPGTDLLSQREILSFDTDLKGEKIITASRDKTVRVWSASNVELQKKIPVGIVGNKVMIATGSLCIVLDNLSKNLKIIDFKEGDEKRVYRNVVDFCLGKECKILYLVKTNDKGHHVEVIDLGFLKSQKSFLLKQSLEYQTLDLSLNESERYLILREKITEKDYADVQASWRKQGGGFLPQSHWHRYYAVDMTQATGGLMPCYRMLTKIPHLGEIIRPYKGNVMMITTRRWVILWDIPTGKCDQRVTKGEKTGFMYRPDHIKNCTGGTSLAMEQSKDGMYIAVGSEDGYMIVWEAQNGFPVGRKEPKKRHTASVENVAISPDSNWVVSNCKNNMLKLWEISTGTEVFSLKIPSDIQQMKFTADSKHLIINTGVYSTRMLVYRLHTGQK